MKVSIIIPVYKVEKYILRCLESVTSQDVTDVELECVVIDDCSPDNSMQMVREFVDNYHGEIRFLLLFHERNKGLSATRNTGVNSSSGDYVFFLDSDDRISSDCISRLTAVLLEYPQADFVMGNIFHAKDQKSYMPKDGPVLVIDSQEELFRRLFDMKIPNSACNRLIRREVLERNQIRFTEGMLYEDLFWNYQFFLVIRYIVLLPDITYTYLCRENSLSHYQQRHQISKNEVMQNAKAINHLKETSLLLYNKVYYPNRCRNIILTDFYIACHILKRRKDIQPSVSNVEIKKMMSHPATFSQICTFRQSRLINLAFFLLHKLPSSFCVLTIWMIGKVKKYSNFWQYPFFFLFLQQIVDISSKYGKLVR